jgi:hypothetical protein
MPPHVSFLLGPLLVLFACGGPRQTATPMQVVSAYPESTGTHASLGSPGAPIPLHLNSDVHVTFSADVDRLTVTSDTVRMVKITPDGPQAIRMAGRRVGKRTVTLIPDWPLTAELNDGSYLPDQLYRLEVKGFPLTNTLRSKTGEGVAGFVRYYKTVPRDAKDPGPLLPVGTPYDPFILASAAPLRMASATGTVRLRFTLPPDPATVHPGAFTCYVVRGNETILPIASTRILTELYPIYSPAAVGERDQMRWSYPASTVELTLQRGVELIPGEDFWIHLKPRLAHSTDSSAHWLRDYRDRPVTLDGDGSYVPGRISGGDQVELLAYPRRGSPHEQPRSLAPVFQDRRLTFEVRDGRIKVLARLEAGTGRSKTFHPLRDTVLQPRTPFDRGDGVLSPASLSFEFSSIHIPEGVTVTLKSAHACEILSADEIRIDGTLLLETPYPAPPEGMDTIDSETYQLRLLQSSRHFGARIVAAGDIHIRGQVRRVQSGERPPVVLRGRSLNLSGSIPRGAIVAAEVRGSVQGVHLVKCPMRPGLALGAHRVDAAAWTPWLRLPKDFDGQIDARAEGIRGDIEVFLQVAPPDPVDPDIPYIDAAGLAEPRRLPLRSHPEMERGGHVRFLLRANVVEGQPLPLLQRLVIVRR